MNTNQLRRLNLSFCMLAALAAMYGPAKARAEPVNAPAPSAGASAQNLPALQGETFIAEPLGQRKCKATETGFRVDFARNPQFVPPGKLPQGSIEGCAALPRGRFAALGTNWLLVTVGKTGFEVVAR